jgi:hypothetical protein
VDIQKLKSKDIIDLNKENYIYLDNLIQIVHLDINKQMGYFDHQVENIFLDYRDFLNKVK